MKWITAGLFSVVVVFGATQKEPSNCSSRPCTYTIRCAASTCTQAEVGEVQTALDDAHRGDTIKLEAGRLFRSNRSLVITARPGSSGYLTITTTQDARLPAPDARVTPAYAPLMPTIAATGPWALGIAGNDTPATYIRLWGLRFSTIVAVTGEGPLLIGNSGSYFGTTLRSPLQQPDNIVVDQCLFEQDYSYIVRRMISVHGRHVTIRNSYIDGIRELNADTQAINAVQGVGPLIIENCYLGGAAENLLLGGIGTYFDGAIEGMIRFNYFPRMEERMRFSPWSGGMVVFRGRVIRPSRNTGYTYVARNSGITGNMEPAWPESVGGTVVDNGITWACVSSSNAHLVAKNNLEIKSARRMQIQHNVFARHWIDGQDNNVVFKLSNCVEGTANCQCVPEYSGVVDVTGASVRARDGRPLPNLHQPLTWNNVDPFNIKINGVDYRIASFEPGDHLRLTLTTDAGTQTGVPYTYGQRGCRSAWDHQITFTNNVIRGGPVGLTIAQWTNGVIGQIGDILVRNNLMEDLDCRKWSAVGGGCVNTRNYLFLGTLPPRVRIHNNTIFGRNAPVTAIQLEGRGDLHAGDAELLNNIFPRGNQGGIRGASHTEGSSSLDNLLCGGKPCPVTQFNKNIIAGVDLRRYSTGETYNLCSTNTGCGIDWDFDDPRYGRLFANYSGGDYSVREGNFAKRGGTDGADIGADFNQLPQIRDLVIETTDRQALFKYRLTEPIQRIPCVVEVSDQRDLSTSIPDLNPSLFSRPGSDRQSDSIVDSQRRTRTIRIGGNVPLSASTTYWYRLHCGGDASEGSFTTKAARSGTRQVTLRATPDAQGVVSVIVEYSNRYDGSTDTLIGPSYTAQVACAAGSSCEVGYSLEAGAISFYRFLYLDQNRNVIARSPMQVSADPGVVILPQPKFTSGDTVNSASFLSGGAAPCQLISFFGANLGPVDPVSLQLTPDGKSVTNQLADTRVLFDGHAAPLLFVSSTQINAVVPAAVAQRQLTEVRVEYKGQPSGPVVLAVASANPGIFTVSGDGRGQGVILNWPDNSVNSPTNPAPRGSVVTAFGTSGGATSPACEDGVIVPEPRHLQLPLSATVGDAPATVTYAGSTPGLVTGVMQFNLLIPDNAPTGDAVPVRVSVGSAQSQDGVTIAIR
ncbi:MAG: hypothetical protein KIT09_04135 [Bryobacteraceae bacterium]|nr:hypothetical protein [Bryobacteraceae bacterium]